MNKVLAGLLAAMMVVAGCATPESREQSGTIIGAIAGAAIGARADGRRGAVIGAMLGGLLGNRLGAYLDERERREALAASQEAVRLPTNERQHWEARDERDPETVTASGWVTPTTNIYARNGRRCRDVTFVSVKDGQEYTEQETLCESPQGWVTS